MDFGGLLVLGLVWLLFSLLNMGRKGERPSPRPRATLPGSVRGVAPGGGLTAGGRATAGGDATQREGSRLEQLLRELERNLEEVGGTQPAPSSRLPGAKSAPQSRAPAAGLPGAEEVENRESYDDEPVRVVSLEGEVHRPSRPRVVQDDAAEELVRRRIEAARARDRALTKADHQAFDARIRREPADHTAVRRFTPAQLRDAIVWREILGPPVSEREG
ncbi:MAG TPA: hypothetical protein VHG35_05310 [Gemmatimonadales bacterium]|nr:hypothetical protein [Gemmatimonadales bacterium]